MPNPNYCKAVEELLIVKGEKKGYYFVGDLTTREILEKMDLPVVRVNHNRTLQLVRIHYPKSTYEKLSGEKGYVLHVRVRTK